MIKKKIAVMMIAVLSLLLLFPLATMADAAPGDVIVTLGEDLSPQQREELLNEMEVSEEDENVTIITVSNEEEHQYLGNYISASVIGSNALSSSKITILESGSGIDVTTNNINWVSEGMYANALITAGVKDADIYVTAPFEVSGTGALTGLIKAYESTMDGVIPEDQKQIANEELVKTAQLGEEHGNEEATELMARIKEALAEEDIETTDDLRDLIRRLADELGISLSDEDLEGLVSLFDRMREMNIDWDQVRSQIDSVRENISDFIGSEQGQGIIRAIINFFNDLLDTVSGWFSSGAILNR
ncbi:DUF1002 domain-containing protein [Salisediminibacterium selenitireducens]|uniref:DUF1002 domain-containing protein n=1 Tax=Bacillus selenitireducens (strain ATCC 700615 / DSM 15326 / MLS10) TaxID=439292 RepID=D6XW74_BACIE|nr:DUF1002 domain-containing protein [Salisediminibacterium selenitireducens]ADH99828.1 protein of unknown function DUF1002 [[Bacillus] selenitireducens MLS10]